MVLMVFDTEHKVLALFLTLLGLFHFSCQISDGSTIVHHGIQF